MSANPSRFASSMGRGYHASAQDWRATTPCRFFQRGSCTKGASCPFSHVLMSRSVVTSQEVTNPSRKSIVGASAYSVQRGEQLEKARATNSPVESPENTKPVCRFFKTGSCIYGEKCQFRHAEEELTVQVAADNAFEVSRLPYRFTKYPFLR